MRRFGKRFWIFVILAVYITLTIRIYFGLRDEIFVSSRTPIHDERVLSIIQQAEEIVKPGVEILYYSLETHSERHPSWQTLINGYYHVSGTWPLQNFDKVFITDVALERLSDRQLLFIIGHELGHVRVDHYWRGKGFILANINLYYSLRAFFIPKSTHRHLFYERIKAESLADEAGIECVGPEDALKFLKLLHWVSILSGFPSAITDGRIELIKDKYDLN